MLLRRTVPRAARFAHFGLLRAEMVEGASVSTGRRLVGPVFPPLRCLSGATASANAIKSKIVGPLVEAQDKGQPIRVGMYAELSHTFEPHHVSTFAGVCGDDNPLHLDDQYAKQQVRRPRLPHYYPMSAGAAGPSVCCCGC